MQNVTRIVTAALAAVTLSLLAAMPLVAAWRTQTEQPTVSVSINAFELMRQASDLPGQQIQDLMTVY